jgi:UDP-N-acetylmuramate dehydrogenase
MSSKTFEENKILILGSGSNILFTKNFDGLILQNKINLISIIYEDNLSTTVEVGGGVNWHDFVLWSVGQNLSGIENLALIPGSVAASPVQNIGAYGMEVKDTITKVHTIDIEERTKKVFNNKECKFKYRDSIFKSELKNKIVITKVEFKLSKTALNIISYGNIKKELKKEPSPMNIAEVIIKIRQQKLPDPIKIGNSGSFFKNPVISLRKFKKIKKKFPEIVSYKVTENKIKIAAGWLIEDAGLKGHRDGDAGVHKNQALVLVNYGKSTGKEILSLSIMIKDVIFKKYDIMLETEVNII